MGQLAQITISRSEEGKATSCSVCRLIHHDNTHLGSLYTRQTSVVAMVANNHTQLNQASPIKLVRIIIICKHI